MAYFVGMLGNLLPLPGGIGGVDGGMIAALIGFGVPGGLAIAAVLSYRAFSFWLPTVPGILAYLRLLRDVRGWGPAGALTQQGPKPYRPAAHELGFPHRHGRRRLRRLRRRAPGRRLRGLAGRRRTHRPRARARAGAAAGDLPLARAARRRPGRGAPGDARRRSPGGAGAGRRLWEARLASGAPARAIAEVAREVGADAIVVGSRGFVSVAERLGSVSAELVRDADRPVTVIPPGAVGIG